MNGFTLVEEENDLLRSNVLALKRKNQARLGQLVVARTAFTQLRGFILSADLSDATVLETARCYARSLDALVDDLMNIQ